MIIDITGVILIPGDQGKSCPGNALIRVCNAAVKNAIIKCAVLDKPHVRIVRTKIVPIQVKCTTTS